eukprot:TRINITY_DN1327_c1_g4_i1.p1 TRINITY_DN1327_c1_g4~~TRINITY_DN1327_c1_g4_i1.p1  ORF type:complete len:233 (+),score=-21.82 TRINITY_DN1327_c1_g4_i1:135-833(+)
MKQNIQNIILKNFNQAVTLQYHTNIIDILQITQSIPKFSMYYITFILYVSILPVHCFLHSYFSLDAFYFYQLLNISKKYTLYYQIVVIFRSNKQFPTLCSNQQNYKKRIKQYANKPSTHEDEIVSKYSLLYLHAKKFITTRLIKYYSILPKKIEKNMSSQKIQPLPKILKHTTLKNTCYQPQLPNASPPNFHMCTMPSLSPIYNAQIMFQKFSEIEGFLDIYNIICKSDSIW